LRDPVASVGGSRGHRQMSPGPRGGAPQPAEANTGRADGTTERRRRSEVGRTTGSRSRS
jgi:hypothetical protein